MATFDHIGSGGISVNPSSTISLFNPNGGFSCVSDNKSVIYQGTWAIAEKRRGLFGGARTKASAYVAAITVCRHNLKDKLKTPHGS